MSYLARYHRNDVIKFQDDAKIQGREVASGRKLLCKLRKLLARRFLQSLLMLDFWITPQRWKSST